VMQAHAETRTVKKVSFLEYIYLLLIFSDEKYKGITKAPKSTCIQSFNIRYCAVFEQSRVEKSHHNPLSHPPYHPATHPNGSFNVPRFSVSVEESNIK